MIKKVLLILSFLLFLIEGNAQNTFKPEWNVGIGFGPTFSSISFVGNDPSLSVDTKMLQQFSGGVSVRYMSEKNLGIIGELNFSQQGWEEKIDDEITTSAITGVTDTLSRSSKHKLNYIELPLLTHISFGNKTRYFLNIGPKFGYMVSDQEVSSNVIPNGTLTSSGTVTENQYSRDIQRKFDYGLMAGLGFELKTKIGSFSLEGRYYLGFGDIYSSRKSDVFSRSANRVLSARLTYYMKLF